MISFFQSKSGVNMILISSFSEMAIYICGIKNIAMKNIFNPIVLISLCMAFGCNSIPADESVVTDTNQPEMVGQSGVNDDVSNPNVVQVAAGSADHTTLVTAVKAADLVNALSNAGPFTVFAPTNAAFEKLPEGTVEGLLSPDKKDALIDILEYHVTVGGYKIDQLTDGQSLGQVNGGNILVSIKDGKTTLNGNVNIITSIQASNGIIHVIDGVLLPK